MVEAILTAIVTIAIVVCIALLAYVIYTHRKTDDVVFNDTVEHIQTYGVGTSSLQDGGITAEGGVYTDIRVKKPQRHKETPSETISTRLTAFGFFIGAVFVTLAAKIWSMQLLNSASYANEANKNLYNTVSTPASRGWIYDRNGVVLVKNKTETTILADTSVANDIDVVSRLSAVLGIPKGVLRQRVLDKSLGAQNQSIISSGESLRNIAFISEHKSAFPGVSIEEKSSREYPYGALCSHVLGYIGAPTEEDLARPIEGRVIESTDTIGKSGVEYYYDAVLSGDKGQRKIMVDATGNVVNVVSETDSTKGSDIYLTIDSYAQYVADKTLAKVVAPKGNIGTGKGVSASVIAMDLEDGGIVVLANYPTFDPSYLINGIPQDIWDLYNSEESHSPFMNRAINGQYAPASTFKAFTSLAGLQHGFATYSSLWKCTGSWDGFGSGDIQKCWKHDGHGFMDIKGGLVHSCDVVFYEIAKQFFTHGSQGTKEISDTALQEYLEKFNFGKTTGIDLEGESVGLLPTPRWKAEQWQNVPSEAFWRGGDFSNMIIGQGDVLVTPIQLLCAYCGIATGQILKPHLLREIKNSTNESVFKFEKQVVANLDVNDDHLAYVRNSLHNMLSSAPNLERTFYDKGLDVAAKSGTAEHTGKRDDSWFAAYGPFDNPKYACVCIVEQGGGGSTVAGPIVAEVLGALCGYDATNRSEGQVSYIQGSSGKSVALSSFDSLTGRQD